MRFIWCLLCLVVISACTPTYMVVFTAGQGGTVSSPGGEYEEGSVVTVNAIPDQHYEFEQWSDGSNKNPLTIGVVEAFSLTAYFKKIEYDFTVNVQGEGSVKQDVLVQGSKLNSGSQVKLTALPASGWYFDSWTGSVAGNMNPLSVDINGSKSITAIFKRKKFDLTISVEGEGTVTEQITVQPGQYDYQTQVKLTAIPDVGWRFVSWTGDYNSTSNPLNVQINSDLNINATFIRKNYDLKINVYGEGKVTKEIVFQPEKYDHGTKISLTAIPSEGWEFDRWSGTDNPDLNPSLIEMDRAREINVFFKDESQNFAPFAATAIQPIPGATISPVDGKVTIKWESIDPDEDILTYTLFVSTSETFEEGDATVIFANLSNDSQEVEVSEGIYYWKVVSADESISVTSDTFSFRIE